MPTKAMAFGFYFMGLLTMASFLGACRGPSTGVAGTSSPTVFDQTSATVASANDLSLTLSLSSASYHTGDQVTITIDEKNTLDTENRVDAADRWPVKGLSLGP